MLEIENLTANIGPTQILRGVALDVAGGSMCGLIGRNGAGKTTVMRTIMGLITARGGRILFEGQDLVPAAGHRRAHLGIGYMPEDRRLVPQLTTEENIMLPIWATRAENAEERLAWIFDLMPEVFARRMIEILQDLKHEGQAVLVAESNDVHISHLLDQTFVIERGSIVEKR